MRFATIEAERHFVQIGREVLGADAMPRANDAALEKRECGFDGVGRDHKAVLMANVLFRFVIDCFTLRPLRFGKARGVQNRLVGHDHVNILADVLLHDFADRLRRALFHVDEFQIAAALDNSDDGFFVLAIVSGACSMTLTADVGFIYFDGSVQHLVDFGHGEADSMAEIPRGFVTDSEGALDLIGAHSFFGFAEQQGSKKPLLQSQMRIVKDCSRRDGELIIAAFAVEQLLGRGEFHSGHFAAWALNTVGPAETHQQFPASFVGIKHLDYVN